MYFMYKFNISCLWERTMPSFHSRNWALKRNMAFYTSCFSVFSVMFAVVEEAAHLQLRSESNAFFTAGAFQRGRRDQSHAAMIKNIIPCASATVTLNIICLHANTQVFFDFSSTLSEWLCYSFFVTVWNKRDESAILLTGATLSRLPSTFSLWSSRC